MRPKYHRASERPINAATEARISHERLLNAAIAAIEVLDFALMRLQDASTALPEGGAKEKLLQEKSRLAIALYEVRMMALRSFPENHFLRRDSALKDNGLFRL